MKHTKCYYFAEAVWLISVGCKVYRKSRPEWIYYMDSEGKFRIDKEGNDVEASFDVVDVAAVDWWHTGYEFDKEGKA